MLLLIIGVLIVVGIIEIVLVETEKFTGATIFLLATAGVAHWLGWIDWLHFVQEHGLWLLAYVGLYIAAGVAWSFGKWFSFLMRMRDAYRQLANEYLESKALPSNTVLEGQVLDGLKEYIRYSGRAAEFGRNALWEKPKAKQNKGRITAWMCWWPLSLVGTILNDPIRRLFNAIFGWFKGLYQQMADRVYRDHPELK